MHRSALAVALSVLLLSPAPAGAASVADVTYPGARGDVPATLVSPTGGGRHPTVIFVHWGQGDRRQFQAEAAFLAGLGVGSLLVDAPWNRPGRKLDFLHHAEAVTETVEDVRRGIDFLTKRPGVDAKRIAFVGHSFGAHVGAVLAGVDKRLVAFVLMGGVASAAEAWRTATHPGMVAARQQPGFDAAMAALAPIEPEKLIAKAAVPLFLQFARRDEFVPVEQAERLLAAAPNPKIYRFYEGDHGFGERARADRIAWLALRLGVSPPPNAGAPRMAAPEAAVPDAPAFFEQRIVGERPGMDAIQVRRDLAYNAGYKLDVYAPPAVREPLPVVVLVHGQAPPAVLRRFKDGGPMTSYARYLAARGLAVVVPNLGSAAVGAARDEWYAGVADVAKNLDDALAYVAGHAKELGLDAGAMCLEVFSAGGAYGVTAGLTRPGVRCIVAWNTFLTADYLGAKVKAGDWSPAAKVNAGSPPMLIVRSERDFPELNAAVGTFLAAAKQAGAKVTVVDIPDAHHAADLFDDNEDTREALRRVVRFLAESL
jgi:dienelactone hydrolase